MISFIVPLFNESESLCPLVNEIVDIAVANGLEHEIILVDDGSTDPSWRQIELLSRQHESVRGLRLRRNFGKGAAMAAGFEAAKGEILFTLDADLQDNPQDIPKLLKQVLLGNDVVVGWRKSRRDTWLKRFQSRVFNTVARRLSGVNLQDINCGFKCFRAEVVLSTALYGDQYRFFPLTAALAGFRVTEIEVAHRQRRFGRSKYGSSRMVRGSLDLLTVVLLHSFRFRPMHLIGAGGFLLVGVGGLGLSYLAVGWCFGHHIGHRPLLIYSIVTCLFGAQMVGVGVLAELFTGYMARTERTFSIAEIVSGGESKPTSLSMTGKPETGYALPH